MKLLPVITAAIIATASFATFAATEIDQAQATANNYQRVGVVSVNGITGSPSDVETALQQKATKEGASYFRIIGMSEPGKSSDWHASAELYR
jgi:hypothetical protein